MLDLLAADVEICGHKMGGLSGGNLWERSQIRINRVGSGRFSILNRFFPWITLGSAGNCWYDRAPFPFLELFGSFWKVQKKRSIYRPDILDVLVSYSQERTAHEEH